MSEECQLFLFSSSLLFLCLPLGQHSDWNERHDGQRSASWTRLKTRRWPYLDECLKMSLMRRFLLWSELGRPMDQYWVHIRPINQCKIDQQREIYLVQYRRVELLFYFVLDALMWRVLRTLHVFPRRRWEKLFCWNIIRINVRHCVQTDGKQNRFRDRFFSFPLRSH